MSLVAYEYSSGEESDQEEVEETVTKKSTEPPKQSESLPATKPEPSSLDDLIEDEVEQGPTAHLQLPAPKKITNGLNVEEEDDDEFLRKKATPEAKPAPPPPLTSIRAKLKNGKVQITIPSLRDFKDDEADKPKPKATIGAALPSNRPTGLLGMLPKPKSEVAFGAAGPAPKGEQPATSKPIVNRLIPDSVANRPRNLLPEQKKKPTAKKVAPVKTGSDSDDSEDEGKLDFFSLNKDEKLPEISINEINVMVAKRAARMAEAAKKFDEPEQPEEQPGTSGVQQPMVGASYSQEDDNIANDRALSSLIGGNKAKRARLNEVNIIDISSADIVPTKEDFMRRQLQDETGFVPTGHLTGDWSCTSKRKSHITYLATKAQANSQELEAMWATNRQSRRQTQSKYGF